MERTKVEYVGGELYIGISPLEHTKLNKVIVLKLLSSKMRLPIIK